MGDVVAARARHADKEVEDAIAFAEQRGWRVVRGNNHAWAKLSVRLRTGRGA